jgi:hypothetical protein
MAEGFDRIAARVVAPQVGIGGAAADRIAVYPGDNLATGLNQQRHRAAFVVGEVDLIGFVGPRHAAAGEARIRRAVREVADEQIAADRGGDDVAVRLQGQGEEVGDAAVDHEAAFAEALVELAVRFEPGDLAGLGPGPADYDDLAVGLDRDRLGGGEGGPCGDREERQRADQGRRSPARCRHRSHSRHHGPKNPSARGQLRCGRNRAATTNL